MADRRTYHDETGRWRVLVHDDDPATVKTMVAQLEQAVADGERMPPGPKVLQKMMDAARRDGGRPTRAMMARLQVLAGQCALTRDDRLELAEVLLRRDVTSWASLTVEEARLIGAALEGFAYICHIQAREGRRWREQRAQAKAAGTTTRSTT